MVTGTGIAIVRATTTKWKRTRTPSLHRKYLAYLSAVLVQLPLQLGLGKGHIPTGTAATLSAYKTGCHLNPPR